MHSASCIFAVACDELHCHSCPHHGDREEGENGALSLEDGLFLGDSPGVVFAIYCRSIWSLQG